MDLLHKVWDTQILKKMPQSEVATDLLNRLVKATEHILKQRKWQVKVLREFYPKNQSLLGMNVNGGAAIMIRLRHPHNEKSFLPWHDILGTMCHELAHMAIGPHNADFYKLWDELSDEVERAGKSSFYNPSGGSSSFVTGSAHVLGGSRLSRDKASDAAVSAAIKRQRLNGSSTSSSSLGKDGGFKLGGSMIGKNLNSIQLRNLIASAAERRIKDDNWCPTQDSNKDYGGRDNQDNDDDQLTIAISSQASDGSSSVEWICQICTEPNVSYKDWKCKFCGIDFLSGKVSTNPDQNMSDSIYCAPCGSNDSVSSKDISKRMDLGKEYLADQKASYSNRNTSSSSTSSSSSSKIKEGWDCGYCTYKNDPEDDSHKCLMCGHSRVDISTNPNQVTMGTSIEVINDESKEFADAPHDVDTSSAWTCNACTYINMRDDNRCAICGTLRDVTPLIDLT